MTPDKSPVDQAIELFVFAPVGLAITARDALPGLIERGRQQVNGQATMARMIGEFAVKEGQNRAARAFDDARQHATSVFEQYVGDGGRALHATDGRRNGASPSASKPVRPAPARSQAASPQSSGTAAELAITDYDSLAASQVVPRLSGLTPAELEQVRLYEAAHRGRKTILSRVAQIQASR